jgi:hypothetical protein
VTNKTGFGFDDGIYWTFIRLVITVHISLPDKLPSFSGWPLHWKHSDFQLNCQLSRSQSHIATDGQSVRQSWCRATSGAHGQIFIAVWKLWSFFRGAPSLTRGRVYLLHMLLTLVRAVFLESESLGTRDHILLSQIWDFPFRRLLRLAGSRCRYSTPPPHVSELSVIVVFSLYSLG